MHENEKLASTPQDDLIRRVRGEYLEMPGLRLTARQAERLWGLDHPSCRHVLDALTETRFLYRREDGTYARGADHTGSRVHRFTRPAASV